MQQTGGAPLVKLPSFDVLIDAIEVFTNTIALKSVKSQGLELHLNRARRQSQSNQPGRGVDAGENRRRGSKKRRK